MPVRDLGGSRLVVRLPDEKKRTNKQKKYLEPRLNKLNSDGEIWVIFGSSGGADVGGDYQELLELGFKGEDDGDPDMYSVPFASGVEIPWAHMVKAKYTDDNFPWMSLLWMMKTSTNWTFEDRPFRIATEEEYVAQMAWLNEKDKPNNVLPSAKATEKIDINATIHGPTGKPKIEPEFFLQISVLMTYVSYDPRGEVPSNRAPRDSPFYLHFCQLISPLGSSVSLNTQPDFEFEVDGVSCKLKDLSVLLTNRDVDVASNDRVGEACHESDSFLLAQSNSRTVSEFRISQTAFQKMYEDCLANKRMQIFDLRFHNDLQRADGFTVECSEPEGPDGTRNQKLRLKSNYDSGGSMYVAEVVGQTSMSVTEYIGKMGFDPVLQYAKSQYEDFEPSDFVNFNEYLERNRAWLQEGKVTHPHDRVPHSEGTFVS